MCTLYRRKRIKSTLNNNYYFIAKNVEKYSLFSSNLSIFSRLLCRKTIFTSKSLANLKTSYAHINRRTRIITKRTTELCLYLSSQFIRGACIDNFTYLLDPSAAIPLSNKFTRSNNLICLLFFHCSSSSFISVSFLRQFKI